MKSVLVILVLVAFVAAQNDKARSIFENVDVDEILNNDRILVSYLKCLLEEGPCTAEGRALKKELLEFQKTAVVCKGCSDKEKSTLKKALLKTKQTQSDRFEKLLKKYATDKKLSDAVAKFIA